ncbi:MAG TPA: carboxypeptidase-like regulatory domain-containing protein [Candidatus Polarisedimenticolia bacterium]|nr:carboxypeptidase-like regulatory domain-containing protein [Candidatus Polarisedimenticolia bacterium]
MGRIFLPDGVTPRSGVVVKVANLSTSQTFASGQTDRSGRYAFEALPSGKYQVAVAASEGLYVNSSEIPVIQGRKTLFSLALKPGQTRQDDPNPPPPDNPPPAENPPPQEPPPAQPPAEKPPETKPEDKKPEEKKPPAEGEKKKDGGFWRSGWGVAVGLGAGAIVLGLLADSIAGDSEGVAQPPSQSTP